MDNKGSVQTDSKAKSLETLFREFESRPGGLNRDAALRSLSQFGSNTIEEKKRVF